MPVIVNNIKVTSLSQQKLCYWPPYSRILSHQSQTASVSTYCDCPAIDHLIYIIENGSVPLRNCLNPHKLKKCLIIFLKFSSGRFGPGGFFFKLDILRKILAKQNKMPHIIYPNKLGSQPFKEHTSPLRNLFFKSLFLAN